jgi:hypothetical protein
MTGIGLNGWLNGLDRIRISISLHAMHMIPMMEEMLMSSSCTTQNVSWDSLLWNDANSLENYRGVSGKIQARRRPYHDARTVDVVDRHDLGTRETSAPRIRNASDWPSCKVLEKGMEEIGWYTPFTESSERLARKLRPTDFFVAK